MQKNKLSVLSTRPLNTGLIDKAALHNILLEEISFIETTEVKDERIKLTISNYLKKNITAVFTSMNGVEVVTKYVQQNHGWNIYCIGNTTKNLVSQSFGKDAIAGCADNAEQLAQLIINDNIKEIVFFCGNKRREQLPLILKEHGISVEEVIVYNTIETPKHIEKKYDGILFFSPSAVESFFSINEVDNKTQLFAIGSTTAQAIQQYAQCTVITSPSPGKEDLVMHMIAHFVKEGIA